MKNYLLTLAVLTLAVLFLWALSIGIDRSERTECLKWQRQAKDYPLYQSATWQLEQCEYHGLPLLK